VTEQKHDGPVTEQQVLAALSKVQEPELHRDLVSLNMVRDISIHNGTVNFTIVLTTPACPLKTQIEKEARAAVLSIPGVTNVNLRMDASVPSDKRIFSKLSLPVRNVIAVASGKGGVGKTTVAVNLAVALSQMGAAVGLLDADIYGPNIPIMMGLRERPTVRDDKLVPFTAYGVQVMSMGFLVPAEQALIWRGPLLHKAISQLFTDVLWGELDYMVVDLPPGTGDAQLSLAQLVPLTGGVIVSTPQDVAWADAVRGLTAFRQLGVPVLGIVENMSYFVCPHCGGRTEIFSHGGGRRAAERLGVPFLGAIALDPAIRESGDEGVPVVVRNPDSPQSASFREVARNLAARISVMNLAPAPELKLV